MRGSSSDCLPWHSGCEQHGGCLLLPRGPPAVWHREEDLPRGMYGFLAPTGAQGVTMYVDMSVFPEKVNKSTQSSFY